MSTDSLPAKRERQFGQKLAYTVLEASDAAGWGKSTTWKLIESGRLRSRLIAGRRLILCADLAAFLEGADEGVSPRGCKARAMASSGEAI